MPGADPARPASGAFTVPLPRGVRLEGLRPKLFELRVQREAARIAALPDEHVAVELERAAAEQSDPVARARERGRSSASEPAIDAGLERAFARGDEARAAWVSRADLLTGEEFAAAVGLSRATVDNRRRTGQLLALELGAKRGVRYPAWQQDLLAEAALRAAFERVLAALGRAPVASRVRFFTQVAPGLGGQTPIEALKNGDEPAVLRAAKTWARGEQGGG